ncbi:hypothetical protein AXF42_Ash019573 [Apostasia shenzhenica]|uniref:Uncharacterized protein n=1 Tax=Apostasia shenzhenica TaxID=1088818 RepID=A0A2I0AV61_9ASPA|nr:hypothetical protein AXF42_Ash019573 [Apostasia shenzhenica]
MEEPPEEQTDNMMAVAAAAAPLPWPAQSLLQPVYDDEGLLPPAMDPVMGQLLMDAGMGRFYQGGIGLPQYGAGTGSGERQGFFGGGTPAMVLPDMDYRSIGMGVYDMDSFQHNGYSASHNQVMGDIPLQQQQQQKQQEISLAGAPMASDISSLEDSTFKVGRISAEERKEKIHRYIKKRNERNFSKKIKVVLLLVFIFEKCNYLWYILNVQNYIPRNHL